MFALSTTGYPFGRLNSLPLSNVFFLSVFSSIKPFFLSFSILPIENTPISSLFVEDPLNERFLDRQSDTTEKKGKK